MRLLHWDDLNPHSIPPNQLGTFKLNIGGYSTTLALTLDQITDQAADADYFAYTVACQEICAQCAQQWTTWRDLIREGGTPPASGAPVDAVVQGMITLRRILSHQAQIGRAEGPFLITHITGVNGSSLVRRAGWLLGHPQFMPAPCSGVQRFLTSKCITRSSPAPTFVSETPPQQGEESVTRPADHSTTSFQRRT